MITLTIERRDDEGSLKQTTVITCAGFLLGSRLALTYKPSRRSFIWTDAEGLNHIEELEDNDVIDFNAA